MGAPQIILLVLIGLQLLITAHFHGRPKSGEHNIFFKLIDAAIFIWILVAGGFFG